MTQRRAVTTQDVARAAGVSTATVSRVLNGASTVDADLAERVRRAAAETRYVPNSTGRALRRQVSDIWAAVVSDVQNPFFTTMVAALQVERSRSIARPETLSKSGSGGWDAGCESPRPHV